MRSQALGRRGEEEAAHYLRERGWAILGRNVRAGRAEVDLVIFRGMILAFVEVKTRSGVGFGDPLEAINPRKREEIARVARAWLRGAALPAGTRIRFDAVAVHREEGGTYRIRHLPDAWRTG